MELGIIIQARLGSSRLPRKIASIIEKDVCLLEYISRALTGLGYPVFIASPNDDEHNTFFRNIGIQNVKVFLGDENDVLKRFVDCAETYSLSSVVRVCADNPFFNTTFLNEMIASWSEKYDFATYYNSSGIPAMRTHYGIFGEVMTLKALKFVQATATRPYYREHVTPFFYERPECFAIKKLEMPEPFWTGLPLRLTVDTAADLDMVREIVSNISDTQDWRAILTYCQSNGLLKKMETEITLNAK